MRYFKTLDLYSRSGLMGGCAFGAPNNLVNLSPAQSLLAVAGQKANFGSMEVADNAGQAVGTGGGIIFTARWVDGNPSLTTAAAVGAYKQTGTTGEFGFGLAFASRENGGQLANRWMVDPSGHFVPFSANSFNVGSASARAATGYFNTLSSSAPTGLSLENGTSNLIIFQSAGDAAPTFSSRSAGTKLVLWPAISGTTVDYALGIWSGSLWMSVSTSFAYFRWFGGTTELMNLTGTGVSFYGGTFYLGNDSRNLLLYSNFGGGPPTLTTRSSGTKITFYQSLSVSSVDYGIGIDENTLWFSVATATNNFRWYGGTTLLMSLAGESLVMGSGALAQSATDGFVYIRSVAGAPSGTPTAFTGRVPMVYDTANNQFYVYNSGWKKVTLA